ncbi:FlgD immunoglobulin-like domain containing protein [Streptomyces longispororuber]|uniref:FlgD immunoglobulin-like domain containing protein n=1 Tax=Streptomyces longispororuber TaxID=68230 RepID=UPI0036FB965B
MDRYTWRRGTVATTASLALSAGLLSLAAPPAVAEPGPGPGPAGTVVVDAADRFEPRGVSLYGAGRTGYLHRTETDDGRSGVLWTEFETGRTRQVEHPTSVNGSVAMDIRPGFHALDLTDLDSGESVAITASSEHYLMTGAFTDRTAVSTVRDRATGTLSLHLLRAEADGTVSDRVVRGLPDGVTGMERVRFQDRDGAVLLLRGPEGTRAYLLDYRTGGLTPLFPALNGDDLPTQYALSADRVLGYWPERDVAYTVERGTPHAAPVRTTIPGPVGPTTARRATMALAGDRILVVHEEALPKRQVGQPLHAVRVGGGSERLLDHAGTWLAPAADGSVLTVGGTGSADWAVRRVLADDAGGVRLAAVRDVEPVRARIDGLALGGGRLTVATAGGGGGAPGERELRSYDLSATGAPRAVSGPEHVAALPDKAYAPCAEDSTCVDLYALGNGRVAYSTGDTVREPTSPHTHRTIAPGTGRVDLVGASGRYTLINKRGKTRYYVGDSENAAREPVAHTFTAHSAALWGTKVWHPGRTTGTVVSYDLKSRKTSAPVTLGSGCVPKGLQVVGRWLYWDCGGRAGVRDLTAKRNITVPKGGALLGDGFLVRRTGTRLDLTDFHRGAGARVTTRRLATVPEYDEPGSSWTVDRFGGHVAYVDAEQRVRVVPVAVPRSPVTSIESRTAATGATWRGTWQLSRPATAWKLTFEDATGKTSGTVRGTAREAATITARWNGRTPDGKRARTGRHTWTLSARGAGDAAYRTVQTGTLRLTGGR